MARRRGLSWRAKLGILLVSFVLVAVAAATYFGLKTRENVFYRTTLDALTALAHAKADAIEQFTEDRRRYVERLAPLIAPSFKELQDAKARAEAQRPQADEERITNRLPELQDAEDLDDAEPRSDGDAVVDGAGQGQGQEEVETRPEPPQPREQEAREAPGELAVDEARTALRRKLGLIAWDHESFEELIVLDTAGRVIISTFKGHEGTTAEKHDYFKKGLKTTFLQPVFHSPISETLTMVISTPIHDDQHDLIGVLVARLNLERFFQRVGDTTGLGETGETVVGKKRNQEIVFMAPTRHDAEAALARRVVIGSEEGRLLQEAATGHSGAGQGVDYRGQPVYAAWRHVKSIDWGLVVKMDREEAMRSVEESKRTTAVVTVVIVLLAVAASLIAAKALVAPLRELQTAAERISRGDLDVSVEIRSQDEIGDLADSFERMIAAIKFFREHAKSETDEADESTAGTPESD